MLAVVAGTALVVALLIAGSVVASGYDRTAGGEVAVIRNGGPLDNNRVRQVLPPASARTWIGIGSTAHKYPAQQRFYTITADSKRGDREGVDVENDPTADGVEVGIEATVYFTLTSDPSALESFDDKYGTRKYRGLTGAYRYAWDGDSGWTTFLDQIVRPVISNDLRQEIGDFRCAELQASCSLVQNAGSGASSATATASNTNISKIQESINASLQADLNSTLGGPFITGVRFNLAKITLPQQVQDAINKAQAAFAGVTEAQARVAQAKADAQANEQRQRGYATCPACALIDEYKAIPPTITTFAPGAGFAVTPSTPR
ncbi:SPFH domain-containing protein [Motilibacter peucedani]|uniref:SPFH domain-containing protein n=1 Tax=Motilibacter peucedani TaxID=598650 RepID=UPI001E65921F|nr:SPFH domain-containing protein [Motilibacter peucedani]